MKIQKSKKSQIDIQWKWPEYFFFILLIIGFLIVIFARSATFIYIFTVLAGLMVGRYLFQRKSRPPVPIYILIYGFVIGFILALMLTRKADWKIALIIFIVSNMLSYYLHERGYVND